MKCHYELLEVSRDADDDTLKKSYRKLALKWHPDKNPDNVDECTQYFALLQQAYEVLSDPHERAFYDKHRESILKGGFDGDYKDDSLDLFQFFTSSCYRGYEGDKGFFTIYRNVFESLANEDYDYIEDPSVRFPSFGDATSDYDTFHNIAFWVTGPFYGFWASFCTSRSFAWLDKYDLRNADNRFEARQIEAENKKYRDAGRVERNDQIRELVSFIRKRDPRIKAYKEVLELRQAESKKKQEEHRRKQIQKNMELAAAYKEDEETRTRHMKHLEEIMAEHDSDTCEEIDEDSADQVPYCLVCDKAFKSQNALNNHENSKQHRKQLQELKKHMKEEDSFIFEKEEEPKEEEQEQKGGKKSKRRNKKKKAWDENSDDDVNETEADETGLAEQVQELNIVNEENDKADLENNLFLTMEPPKKEAVPEKQKKKRRAEKKPNGVIDAEADVAPEPVVTAEPKTATCAKCGEFFESRSRLFAHLKETGHASTKYAEPTIPVKNKKGKRK